jgi:hypothetical protein
MRRGVALVNWQSGLLAYVEADEATLERFREILRFCGGVLESRTLPCLTSLASRLNVKPLLYITDIYGIANSIAFEKKTARAPLLEKAWKYLEGLLCRGGEVECGEDVALSCCKPCGDACLLAVVLGYARIGTQIDLTKEIRKILTS